MIVRRVRLEDEVLEADSPLGDGLLQLLLEHLDAFGVPDLQQDLCLVVQRWALDFDLSGHELHLFIVRAGSSLLVHRVQTLEVNRIAAIVQVLLRTHEVELRGLDPASSALLALLVLIFLQEGLVVSGHELGLAHEI